MCVPCEPRGELSELLFVQFVEALRHFVSEGIGDNRLRAPTSDLAYLDLGYCFQLHSLPCRRLSR